MVLSISGCLSHERKTGNQTDQSKSLYLMTSAILIGQFDFPFYVHRTSNLKLTVYIALFKVSTLGWCNTGQSHLMHSLHSLKKSSEGAWLYPLRFATLYSTISFRELSSYLFVQERCSLREIACCVLLLNICCFMPWAEEKSVSMHHTKEEMNWLYEFYCMQFVAFLQNTQLPS